LPQSIALPLSYRGIFVCKKTSSCNHFSQYLATGIVYLKIVSLQ
jgi:hypothetical protein